MKTLLIKDFMLVKSQKRSVIYMALLVMAFAIFNMNPSFAISYGVIAFSIIAINTIAYDEYEHSNLYLFSMPIEKDTYATEKYIFSGIVMLVSGIIISAVIVIAELIKHQTVDSQFLFELRCGMMAGLIITVVMLILTIPVQLKYGPEKGRIILFGIAIFIVLGVFMLENLDLPNGMSVLEQMEKWMSGQTSAVIWGCTIVAGILALTVSVMISRKIMERKEF